MGLFGRKKMKTAESSASAQGKPTTSVEAQIVKSSSPSSLKNLTKVIRKQKSLTQQNSLPDEPSMQHLPDLILDLETAVETSNDRPASALRKLFALSEHGHTDDRTDMVRVEGGRLVPALLSFLNRCNRGSSEQYLTLLVLNNISIPSENKRVSGLAQLVLVFDLLVNNALTGLYC
jgi:hypothetical protein